MKRILIVEDDAALAEGVALALRGGETAASAVPTLAAARTALGSGRWDLILLDVNLPDGSGVEFLRDFRRTSDARVIFLTANDTEMDMVLGLESGADDYVTKPFSLAVLRARVAAQLRRDDAAPAAYQAAGCRFDFERMDFQKDGAALELSKAEQKLLRALVENRGAAVGRETLLERIWPDGAQYVDENALSVTVKRLRDKLGDAALDKTVYGVGYAWAVK